MKSSETVFVLLLFPKLSVKLTNILASLLFWVRGKPKTKYSTGLNSRLWIFRGSAGPQPLRISLSLAMAEFSVKSCALFMWWRVFGACSRICYLTGQYIGLGVKQPRDLPSLKWLSCWKLLWKWCISAVGIFIYYQDDAFQLYRNSWMTPFQDSRVNVAP